MDTGKKLARKKGEDHETGVESWRTCEISRINGSNIAILRSDRFVLAIRSYRLRTQDLYACYQEIVQDSRIVYIYTLDEGETRMSVSVTTVEIKRSDNGTQLIYTEQGAFFDGHDIPEQREHGTKFMLDKLGLELQNE